ncbi:hypothetical protein [Novosphingobium decolorationis]|uniref:DUF2314 domain-containing protein n=1 Tax=Novosphingobium decolorationis TaxID=2698673 RepID=A0ABX8E6F8_9SPHN|nr:hypothetical protein [Novosphingobium decolorationis]QVM84535.1 DUF2314 domain-containing protein [Novosphingobium decolorationis]
MREPDLQVDGWCLDDGEVYHAAAPDTFWIPSLGERENLAPGDLVKLIFRIQVDCPDEPVAVERMWVLVRARYDGGFLGLLDNDPSSIRENDTFWSGIELPFQPCHVIDIDKGDAKTRALAQSTPRRRWPGAQAV